MAAGALAAVLVVKAPMCCTMASAPASTVTVPANVAATSVGFAHADGVRHANSVCTAEILYCSIPPERLYLAAGMKKHPGANFVKLGATKMYLKYGDRRRIAADLKVRNAKWCRQVVPWVLHYR